MLHCDEMSRPEHVSGRFIQRARYNNHIRLAKNLVESHEFPRYSLSCKEIKYTYNQTKDRLFFNRPSGFCCLPQYMIFAISKAIHLLVKARPILSKPTIPIFAPISKSPQFASNSKCSILLFSRYGKINLSRSFSEINKNPFLIISLWASISLFVVARTRATVRLAVKFLQDFCFIQRWITTTYWIR